MAQQNVPATSSTPGTAVHVTKASYALQRRVGKGPLHPNVLARCNEVMNTNPVDFMPIAMEFLNSLDQGVRNAKTMAGELPKRLEQLTRPVMELKANARMFHYDLVTNLANIMLGFLEGINDLDDAAIEIVAAHHYTLTAIVERRMTGNGGQYGELLIQELKDACNRYFQKRGMRPLSIALN